MVAVSSARGREGLERHQWVVEGELYRTFVIFGRRSDYSGVIVQALPKLFLSIKDWRSAPFARGCGCTLVNNTLRNVALDHIDQSGDQSGAGRMLSEGS